jgi:putative glutamine amidotransferase
MSRPLIGVTACSAARSRGDEGLPTQTVDDKYLLAVVDGAGGLPVVLPAFGDLIAAEEWIDRLDGLLCTGSPSHVEPATYGGPASAAGAPHDAKRDRTTLPLIRAALAAGLPLLAICRGHQELNVALGGTLDQELHALPAHLDHRARSGVTIDEQYGPAHEVRLVPGGVLHELAGGAERVFVNSLHHQGIARLAEGLVVEATAPDGTVEGVRVREARGFALGVQWHPEFRTSEDPLSLALFRRFGEAAKRRAAAPPGASPSGRPS